MNFYKKTLIYVVFAMFCSVFEAFCQENKENVENEKYFEDNFSVNIREKNNGFVANFKDWSIYKSEKNGRKICYILSTPIQSAGDKIKRATPYFLVNNLLNDADEITFVAGFYFKKNSDVEISFGPRKFYLFSYQTRGWAYNKNDDIDIIKEMQKNAEFITTSYSKGGRRVLDKYSLIGFKQAYFKLKEICKK